MINTDQILTYIRSTFHEHTIEPKYRTVYFTRLYDREGFMFNAVIVNDSLIVTDAKGCDITQPQTFETLEQLESFMKLFVTL